MIFEHNHTNKIATCGLVAGILFFSAQAQSAANITDIEMAMLPPYCQARMRSKDPVVAQAWAARLGHDNWIHMHHYCDALVEIKRVYHLNAYERRDALHNAVWQFDYMLSHTQPDFFMRPDFHYGKGLALQLQKDEGEAIAEFQKAVEIRPDFISSRIELAKSLNRLGKKDMALSTLKQGLEKSPENQSLRRLFQEFGGDLSTIPEAVVEPRDEPAKSVESNEKISGQSTTKTASTPESNQSMTQGPTEQKIGKAKNPWCRFCTDEESPVENK